MSNPDNQLDLPPLTVFRHEFVGRMDLFADRQTVMDYLDRHQGWFRRCAHPFRADPIGENGYAIGIGKIGAFGFKVDPRVGLHLLPQEQGVYRICTIPIPDQEPQGYEVDFRAEMYLQEEPVPPAYETDIPLMTKVEWHLLLTVSLRFPPFIYRLPQETIQSTGDAILAMVVRRVSNSLTRKVQADFHHTHNIQVPKKYKYDPSKTVVSIRQGESSPS
ncbi:MAG: DUF1997 domain-containing protein [Pseudanabaenaceae cyanobacterium]